MDNLHTGKEAREKLMNGIRKASQAVAVTMGTSGSNSLIEAIESPGHYATNDGATILGSIKFADPIEEMGRSVLHEAVSRANKNSGDGSSTTCVLTAAILEEGMKHIGEVSPMEIKRSLEDCIPLIEKSINEQKKEITVDEVGAVAAISAEDEQIGATIGEIYKQIGKDGIISWDISKTAEDSYTLGQGITMNAGWYSPYLCDASETGQPTNQVRLKNPYILITKQKISTAADFNELGGILNAREIKDLIVFCDEIDPLVIADLVRTRLVRGFRFIIVKMPTLWKDWWYEDLAVATGAKIVDPAAGLPMKEVKMEHLGQVGFISITKDETMLDGMKDVSKHVKMLNEEATEDTLLRASRLNTKTARYFVGAHSDSALAYRRLKTEDSIAASWHALNGGIVAGGGVALLDIANSLDGGNVGIKILKKALQAPFNQIVKNAGIVMGERFDSTRGMGFDTRTNKVVNMFDAHITDPATIVMNAVKNAIGVSASILTTQTIVTLPRQVEDAIMR